MAETSHDTILKFIEIEEQRANDLKELGSRLGVMVTVEKAKKLSTMCKQAREIFAEYVDNYDVPLRRINTLWVEFEQKFGK